MLVVTVLEGLAVTRYTKCWLSPCLRVAVTRDH